MESKSPVLLEIAEKLERLGLGVQKRGEIICSDWGGEFRLKEVDSSPKGRVLSISDLLMMGAHELAIPIKKIVQLLDRKIIKVILVEKNEVYIKLEKGILNIVAENGFLPCSEETLVANLSPYSPRELLSFTQG